MNSRTRHLGLSVALVLAAVTGAHAQSQAELALKLDYQAVVKGCPSSDRFADEVSAKLGFVPWNALASDSIRVRITKDKTDLVGTIEQPDGTSKVLRAASCAKLDEALVSAIAVALDQTTTIGMVATPREERQDERRLRRLDRDTDKLVTIELKSRDGRELEISRVLSSTVLYTYNARAAAISFEKICKAPCSAQLPPGTHTFLVRDVKNNYTLERDATVKVSSTLELDYTSHAETRAITMRRTKWGLLIGFIAGTVATAYLVESSGTYRALHALDICGGTIGMIPGALIGRALGPGMPSDETRINVRPGVSTVATF